MGTVDEGATTVQAASCPVAYGQGSWGVGIGQRALQRQRSELSTTHQQLRKSHNGFSVNPSNLVPGTCPVEVLIPSRSPGVAAGELAVMPLARPPEDAVSSTLPTESAAMIRRFSVTNLNKRLSCDLTFHPDINVITGRNGSGKTTLLKLLWYMTSGNIERIQNEIIFDKAVVETDSYQLELEPDKEMPARKMQWSITFASGKNSKGHDSPESTHIERANKVTARYGSSLFFPTFRRIEGGFSMGTPRQPAGAFVYGDMPASAFLVGDRLSVGKHRFITSISTQDIVSALTNHYADVSGRLNEDHRKLSEDIFTLMRTHDERTSNAPSEALKLEIAQATLSLIQEHVQTHAKKQEDLLRPFSALNELIVGIFQHKGIHVTPSITLGEAQAAITSDHLSAGEKQMLSFLVYNTFEKDSVIFIDEPEISLHVDWQRRLFPTLLGQSRPNQFIVATHSPFIYSQYSDRELMLHDDRGGDAASTANS